MTKATGSEICPCSTGAATGPLELSGPAWHALAIRLGHASVQDMLKGDDFQLRPAPDGWRCEWRRYYDGVRSDARWVSGCASVAEVRGRINQIEDAGDADDERRRREGEDL